VLKEGGDRNVRGEEVDWIGMGDELPPRPKGRKPEAQNLGRQLPLPIPAKIEEKSTSRYLQGPHRSKEEGEGENRTFLLRFSLKLRGEDRRN